MPVNVTMPKWGLTMKKGKITKWFKKEGDSVQKGEKMHRYTLFAKSCYIILRGLQVLLEEHVQKTWYKRLIKTWTVVMLYASLVSLIVFYGELAEIQFLGFKAGD